MRTSTLGLLVFMLVACSGGGKPAAPTTQNIGGHVTVKDVSFGIHKSCATRWRGENDDITVGTQVVIKDAAGAVVASTALYGPFVRQVTGRRLTYAALTGQEA